MNPQPTIGRTVHYVLADGEHRPAVIVRVNRCNDGKEADGSVNLQVFLDGENDKRWLSPWEGPHLAWRTSVPYDEACSAGSWHWPPRS